MDVVASRAVPSDESLIERHKVHGFNGWEKKFGHTSFAHHREDPEYLPLHNLVTKQLTQWIHDDATSLLVHTRILEAEREIFESFLKALSAAEKLQSISFRFHILPFEDTSQERWRAVMAAIGKLTNLSKLNFRNAGICLLSSHNMNYFFEMLTAVNKLTTLNFAGGLLPFTANADVILAPSVTNQLILQLNVTLSRLKKLKVINISHNAIGLEQHQIDSLIRHLGSIKTLTSVRAVDLFKNQSKFGSLFNYRWKSIEVGAYPSVPEEGDIAKDAEAWLDDLGRDRYLESFSIQNVSSAGAGRCVDFNKLMLAVKTNTYESLSALDLHFYDLTVEDVQLLYATVKGHRSLSKVSLYVGGLDEQAFTVPVLTILNNMIRETPRLVKLTVNCELVPEEEEEKLEKEMKRLLSINQFMIDLTALQFMDRGRFPLDLCKFTFSFLYGNDKRGAPVRIKKLSEWWAQRQAMRGKVTTVNKLSEKAEKLERLAAHNSSSSSSSSSAAATSSDDDTVSMSSVSQSSVSSSSDDDGRSTASSISTSSIASASRKRKQP